MLLQLPGMEFTVHTPALAFREDLAKGGGITGCIDAGIQKHLVHYPTAEGNLTAGPDLGFFAFVDVGKVRGGGTDVNDKHGFGTKVDVITDRVGLDCTNHDRPGLRDHMRGGEADGLKNTLIAGAIFRIPAGRAADIDRIALLAADKCTAVPK